MEGTLCQSLYENLDFSQVYNEKDSVFEKYLKDAATDYEKAKAYTEYELKPPVLETGYSNCVLGRRGLTSIWTSEGTTGEGDRNQGSGSAEDSRTVWPKG